MALVRRFERSLLLAIVAFATTASAQTSGVLDDYTVASWTDRDNLPSARIWGIEQDTDGYLWLGTDAGIFRFDGVKFAPIETLVRPPFPVDRPVAMLAACDGSLWLGYGAGNVVRVQGGQVRTYGEGTGATVYTLLEAHDGTLWAGTGAGLFRLRHEKWDRIADEGLAQGPILAVFEDHAHQLWTATRTAVLRKAPNEEAFHQVGLAESSGFLGPQFSEDVHGGIWMTDRHQGFRDISGTPHARAGIRVEGSGVYLAHDRHGTLWVATQGQGLWRVRAEPTGLNEIDRVTVKDGLLSDAVRAIREDREGNIWVGTYSGLQRFSPRRVKGLTTLGIARALTVTPDGSVWVATATGLARITRSGIVQGFGEADGLPGPTVLALHTDRTGVLWAGTDRGVARLVNGRFVHLPAPAEGEMSRPMTLTSFGSAVWIRDTDRGLFKWEDGTLTPVPLKGSATMRVDREGRMWLGGTGGQVTIIMPTGTRRTEHLPIGTVSAMYEDRTSGAVWIGGASGLARFANGRFVSITRDTGFPADVLSMVTDEMGAMWVAVPVGIVRVEQAEFDKAAATPGYQLRYLLFDASDGSAGVPTRSGGPNAVRDADGRLWFSTGNGLTIVDPKHLGAPRQPPAVRIESGTANAQRFDVVPALSLPARTSHLQLEFTSLTLTDPARVRFRYRLDGFDSDWTDAGTSRQATYTNLPPRDYRFRVMASNNDGSWNQPGEASWSFTILPAWYETKAFYLGCLLAMALLLWGAWRYRVMQVRRQFALVLAERIRMSRTIHDTLLQGMVGIALQFNDLSKTVDATPVAREQLGRIRRQVEDYIREARSSIWDLRSPRLEQRSLADALREAGERVTAGTHVAFDLEVTGTPRECSSKTAEQLLLIGQEAVSNAVRHAQAHHVRMELRYEDDRLRLCVSDDGRGFDIEVARNTEGHYGLISMRERAEQVRGWFSVVSAPGTGTQIEAIVPTT
jgi:signal transduction histidine kinase/ligand-binding sensor domain-containing protein